MPERNYGRRTCYRRVRCGSRKRWPLLSALCSIVLVTVFDARAETPSSGSGAYASSYAPLGAGPLLIRNAIILDGKGDRFENADILIREGIIAAIGVVVDLPHDVRFIEATGKWVTPGIIDIHSHLGILPSPSVAAHNQVNEATNPNTADVWAEHGVWPQDPGFHYARTGGVTSLHILPGSTNLFGGRSVTLKNVPRRTVREMKFPGAPHGLKMACGENPSTFYAAKGRAPSTRMGVVSEFRKAWIEASSYKEKWDAFAENALSDGKAAPPKHVLALETLKGVLEGEIIVHIHCYRADDMATMMDLADEFDFRVAVFHHAVEAYKIADLLKKRGACAAVWSDLWGFKMEAYDGVPENISMLEASGGCAIIHSDSARKIQSLNLEVARALAHGRKAGLSISKAQAWKWLSFNPAQALGIADQTGSLEVGKDADLVLWTGDPFSVRTKAEKVFIDGDLTWDLHDPAYQAVSDFELGQPGEGDVQ